ncbi:MAG: stage II sporulation protein P, partial [Bacillota bacterium]
ASDRAGGPGLLFVLVALLVVAVVGARFLGFVPGRQEAQRMGQPQQRQQQPRPQVASTPAVLVYHAHTTENYQPASTHERGKPGGVVAVGAELAAVLEQRGIRAVHDRTVHDYPNYSEAFVHSVNTVNELLRTNADVVAVLDIHRDALPSDYPDGYTTAEIDGQKVAKILLVIGDVANPYADQNLAFAEALRAKMNDLYPGLSRGIKVQHAALNGHVHPNAVTVFIGDYRDNTLDEAKGAARMLGEAVARLFEEQATGRTGSPVPPQPQQRQQQQQQPAAPPPSPQR